MNSYLVHFAIYSFAMTGFIAIALFVYKKSMYFGSNSSDRGFLHVENKLRLTPGKVLYVIKAGDEKFLIAGDNSTTTMLSKLDNTNNDIKCGCSYSNSNEKISDISSLKKYTKKMSRG